MGLGSPIPDFVGVSGFKEIQERFMDAAQSIMVDYEIVRGANRWRTTALELYLFTETSNVWRDPNTHRNPEQAYSGTWYVHRRPMNRSGLDITAGNIRHGLYVGLLIREIDLIDGGPVARLVGIKGGVVSGVFNLESSSVEALDWRPRHDEQYDEA